MRIAAIILLIILFLPAQTAAQDFRRNETDEFTGRRYVQTPFVSVTLEEEGHDPLYTKAASIANTNGKWIFTLFTMSDSWVFAQSKMAYFLVDGNRHQFKIPYHTDDVGDDGLVSENVFIGLDVPFVNEVARASTIRMKIGQYVFDITAAVDDEVEKIKSVL